MKKLEKIFRVFVDRHYIAVEYFDIKAKTVESARKKAVKAAYKVSADPRELSVDNGWIADDGIEIERVGFPGNKMSDYKMKEITPGVYHSELKVRRLK